MKKTSRFTEVWINSDWPSRLTKRCTEVIFLLIKMIFVQTFTQWDKPFIGSAMINFMQAVFQQK